MSRANELASQYLSFIDSLNSTATYVTDKMPQNFLFLGTAELLFPDSRIIHCTRDPIDTCLSCFMTDFAAKEQIGYDLKQLAATYRDYQRLMEHWKHVLKLPILDVRYEDVVADLNGQTRRMLDFLELPFDERCLKYYENKRVSATASLAQVRKPIYATSIGRWKKYEKHAGPLLPLLHD